MPEMPIHLKTIRDMLNREAETRQSSNVAYKAFKARFLSEQVLVFPMATTVNAVTSPSDYLPIIEDDVWLVFEDDDEPPVSEVTTEGKSVDNFEDFAPPFSDEDLEAWHAVAAREETAHGDEVEP